MYDIVVRNGSVVDGSGSPARRADIAIKDGKIVRIGDLKSEPSDRKIDASKRIVSPGFIDMHAHSDFTLLANPFSYSKIHQGITTEVVGNCGMSMAPYDRRRLEEVKQYLGAFLFGQRYAWNWSTAGRVFPSA